MMFPTNKRKVTEKKLRGGYYTPVRLARFLVDWGLTGRECRILEPSAGNGNFIIAIIDALREKSATLPTEIVAVEIDRKEICIAQDRVSSDMMYTPVNIRWINDDFFNVYDILKDGGKFDLVVGNPPFIRFQHFEDKSREKAFRQLRDIGYQPTKLANAWVAFVELSIELLKDEGKLAMVVPAELLQVKYAAELRQVLGKHFKHITLISFRRLVFPEIQQEILLLMAAGKQSNNNILSDIHTIELEDGSELLERCSLEDTIVHKPARHTRNGMKWTSLFLSDYAFHALDTIEQHPQISTFGELADVNIGIVTGRNSFFVLTEEMMRDLNVEKFVTPIIGRTKALRSIYFSEGDFAKYTQSYPAYLLNLKGINWGEIPEEVRDYLSLGEREGVHQGYKCRIRDRWFDVPSIYIPDAFMFRQVHKFPLVVVNKAQVTSTDTIHRVRFKQPVNAELFAASFFNSLTLAWAEVSGRSYGGGVLEIEPREATKLPVPYNPNSALDSQKVNCLLQRGNHIEALDYVDSVVLGKELGIDKKSIMGIRKAWRELQYRRNYRK